MLNYLNFISDHVLLNEQNEITIAKLYNIEMLKEKDIRFWCIKNIYINNCKFNLFTFCVCMCVLI